MQVPTKMKAPTDAFLEVVRALNALADQQGVSIHITVPTAEAHMPPQRKQEDREQVALQRQRADLAWLEGELRTSEADLAQLKGNYVAVHNRQIVAFSEDKGIALLGAVKSLRDTVDQKEILVVPICVCGTEADEDWLDAKRNLGL